MLKLRWGSYVVLLTALVCLTGTAVAATLAQNFRAVGDVANGNIVSLDKEAGTVVRANRDNIDNLYGVVVSSSDVSFSQAGTQGVPVASGGVIPTLVSTLKGPINFGDPITVSGVDGVGEKAILPAKIIGIAQDSLDENSGTTFSLEDGGVKKDVKIGMVSVKIEVNNFNGKRSDSEGKSSRNKVLELADSLAGKQVKAIALAIASLIVLIAVFVSTFLITSSGYASMISVGRNPLSEKKIMRGLVRILSMAVGIFVVGLLLAYVILKVF